MALQSIANLRLLNGLLPISTIFDLSFQFVILHLLVSVFTQFHLFTQFHHTAYFGRPFSRHP